MFVFMGPDQNNAVVETELSPLYVESDQLPTSWRNDVHHNVQPKKNARCTPPRVYITQLQPNDSPQLVQRKQVALRVVMAPQIGQRGPELASSFPRGSLGDTTLVGRSG